MYPYTLVVAVILPYVAVRSWASGSLADLGASRLPVAEPARQGYRYGWTYSVEGVAAGICRGTSGTVAGHMGIMQSFKDCRLQDHPMSPETVQKAVTLGGIHAARGRASERRTYTQTRWSYSTCTYKLPISLYAIPYDYSGELLVMLAALVWASAWLKWCPLLAHFLSKAASQRASEPARPGTRSCVASPKKGACYHGWLRLGLIYERRGQTWQSHRKAEQAASKTRVEDV